MLNQIITPVKEQLYFDYKNKRYYVDNKNVVLDYSKKELEIAHFLKNTFGGEIYILPRINFPKGIKTPDYLWNNEYWDLKAMSKNAINKTRAIDNIIKPCKKQTPNFIIDVTKTNINRKLLITQTQNVIKNREKWINKIILIDHKKILKIYKKSITKKPSPLQTEWEWLSKKIIIYFFILCQIYITLLFLFHNS